MRQLATIQEIETVSPIENSSNLEVARMKGLLWDVVCKLGEFKPGDRCIYIEIDSVLPDNIKAFEFMQDRKYRVKTIKLRGQLSQGIIFPIALLDEVGIVPDSEDVTDALGIKKYEPNTTGSRDTANRTKQPKTFPSFIQQTDATRIQSCSGILAKYPGVMWIGTEKLDGSSMTIYLKDGKFGVCSRNHDVTEQADSVFVQAAVNLGLEQKLRSAFTKDIAVQGELVGPKIQGNKYGLKSLHFVAFDVFDISSHEYITYDNHEFLFGRFLDLEYAPKVDSFALAPDGDGYAVAKSLVSRVDGMASKFASSRGVSSLAEGVVYVAETKQKDPKYGRLKFKVISNSFLLKYGG